MTDFGVLKRKNDSKVIGMHSAADSIFEQDRELKQCTFLSLKTSQIILSDILK